MANDENKYRDTSPADGNGSPANRWDMSVSTEVQQPAPEPEHRDNDIPAGSPAPVANYPIWITILATLGVFIVAMVIGQLTVLFTKHDGESVNGFPLFLRTAITFGITIGFAWWMGRRNGTLPRRPLSFSLKKTNLTLILWGLALIILTTMVLEPLLDLFPREYIERVNSNIGSGGWAMLTTIIAIPILEEVLFRGIIQQELTAGYGRIKGVLMAAAIFGVMHMNPPQAINAFFIGIILGYLYIRSGSLVPAITIHAINNAIAFLLLQLVGNGLALSKDLFRSGTLYWIVYAICCVLLLLAGWKLLRELNKLDKTDV